MSFKISVIVPVYNAEQYIGKCIESILNQSHQNLELILVNDGSPDRAGEVCDAYAAKDPRIMVLHQLNQGVSVARNNGLNSASGEYVVFIDSDDWIESDFLQTYVLEVAINSPDLIYQGLINENNGLNTRLELPAGFYKDKLIADAILIVEYKECLGGACNKLFKNKIIQDHKIRFTPALSFGEDKIFTLEYFKHVSSVSLLNSCKYHYNRTSENSLSRTHHHSKDLFLLVEKEYDLFNDLNSKYGSEDLLKAVNGRWMSMSKYGLLAMYRPNMIISTGERMKKIQEIKDFKKSNRIDLKFDRDVPKIVDFLINIKADFGIKLILALRHQFSGIYNRLRG